MKTEPRLGGLLLAGLCALVGAGAGAAELSPAPESIVRAYVDAFNARELDALLALATEEIEWLNLDGTKVSVETSGKPALRESLTAYFASCPSCRSTLEWVASAGSRVAAYERASWTGNDGAPRSQSSLSVYELVDGKIARVYYYPVER